MIPAGDDKETGQTRLRTSVIRKREERPRNRTSKALSVSPGNTLDEMLDNINSMLSGNQGMNSGDEIITPQAFSPFLKSFDAPVAA